MSSPDTMRNSFAMVAVVAVKLVATSLVTIFLAIALQTLIGTQVSVTLFLLFAAIVCLRVIFVAIEWRTTTYELSDAAVEYRVGKINVSTQSVPYHSIHGIQQDAPWLLRLFNRSELRIDSSAGDNGTQVHFAALSDSAAAQIIGRIRDAHNGKGTSLTIELDGIVAAEEPTGPALKPKARSERAAISLYSLVRGRYILAVPFAIASLGLVAQLTSTDYVGAFQSLSLTFAQLDVLPQTAVLVGGTLATVLIGFLSRLLSMLNFQHGLSATHLETRQGAFSTRTRSLARSDVTLVDLRQPLLYRIRRRAMVFASGGTGKGDPPLDLSPNIPAHLANQAITWAFPTYSPTNEPEIRTASRYIWTVSALSALVVCVIATAAFFLAQSWAYAAAVAMTSLVAYGLSRLWSTASIDSACNYVEVSRRWVSHRRLVFPITSILHFETVHALAGSRFPRNRIVLVIADRGTRTVTIRGLSQAQLADIRERLAAPSMNVGSYSFLRNTRHIGGATSAG